MNTTQAIIILMSIYGFLIAIIIYAFKWMNKNDVLLSIDEYKDGVLFNNTYRGRFVKNNFFKTNQLNFLNKGKPFKKFHTDKYKKYLITCDSKPIVQPKKVLNVLIGEYKNYFWKPPTIVSSKGLIDNLRIVELNNIRKELWDFTDNTSKADMIYKFVLPMALITLAIACFIFFPKIYDKIMSYSQPLLEQATNQWIDSLKGVKKPLG